MVGMKVVRNVTPSIMKHCFELLPEHLIVFMYPCLLGCINSISKFLLLGIDPIIDYRSPDVGEHCKHSIEWFDHRVVSVIN